MLNEDFDKILKDNGLRMTDNGFAATCPVCHGDDVGCVVCCGIGYLDDARLTTLSQVLGAEPRPAANKPCAGWRERVVRFIVGITGRCLLMRRRERELITAELHGVVDAYIATSRYSTNG